MGPAWRNSGMSMRNPMSREPMNNNPMGVQAQSQLNYAPNVSFQRAAQNVLMQQPPGADTRMRGLNMPGMQFDPNQNAMVRQQRPQLMFNPSNAGNLSGGALTRTDDQKWSRMARQAGVRPQDMDRWRQLKMAETGGPKSFGPTGGMPVAMGAQQGAVQPQPIAAIQDAKTPAVPANATPSIPALRDGTAPLQDKMKATPITGMSPFATTATPGANVFSATSGRMGQVSRATSPGTESTSPASWSQMTRSAAASRGVMRPPLVGALGIIPALGGFNIHAANPPRTSFDMMADYRPGSYQPAPFDPASAQTAMNQVSRGPQSLFGSLSGGLGSSLSTGIVPAQPQASPPQQAAPQEAPQADVAPSGGVPWRNPAANRPGLQMRSSQGFIPQMRAADPSYMTDGISPYLQRAHTAAWRQLGY